MFYKAQERKMRDRAMERKMRDIELRCFCIYPIEDWDIDDVSFDFMNHH